MRSGMRLACWLIPTLIVRTASAQVVPENADAAVASTAPDAGTPDASEPTNTEVPESATAVAPPPVSPTEEPGVGEMVVTAERRRANLQDTPISITAVTGDSLRERGAVDVSALADATPNLQLTTAGNGSGGSNFAQVFIRGVGQADFIITKDPAVGIYVDGVYLARAPGALLELLDIERVEVLRGPQGTLFGKNTAGGAIQVITRQPEGEFGGMAELRVGSYGQRDLSGSFQTALVEQRLFLRASGMSLHRDGYYDRLRPGAIDGRTADGNNVDSHTGRVSLRWTPTDNIDVVLAADGSLQRETATDYQLVGVPAAPNIALYNQVVLAPRAETYDARWIAPRPWTTYSTGASYNNSDVWGTSGTVSWDLGPLQLKSITAYRALRVSSKADADGSPFDIVASDGILVKQHQISQELQVTGHALDHRLNMVGGLWYFQERANDTQSSRQLVGLYEALEAAAPRSIAAPGQPMCPSDGSGPATCLGGPGNPSNTRYDQTRLGARQLRGRSYAAFGHATFKATDHLGFTAGARISREEKDFDYYETRPLQNNLVSFDHVKANPGWNVFTPKLGVDYRFTPALMAYASYALGFKAGGVNGRPTRPDLFTSFGPEHLTTFELGAKTDLLDKRVRLNLALFFSRYTDIQITRNTVDSEGAFIRLEQNAGDASIRGLEAEATVAPVRGLLVGAGLGYTDFNFTSLLPQQAQMGTKLLTTRTQLPFSPKLVSTVSAAYRIPIAQAGFLSPRIDANYNSGYYIDIDNTSEVKQGSYLVLNARLAFSPADLHWELYVAAQNLTDRAVIGSGVAAPANGSQIVSYRPPRMIFAGVRFNLD
jgi:iron complex outermembrane receptor protein